MVNLGVSGLAPCVDALEGLILLGKEGLLLFFDGVDLLEDEAEAGGERGGFWRRRRRV